MEEFGDGVAEGVGHEGLGEDGIHGLIDGVIEHAGVGCDHEDGAFGPVFLDVDGQIPAIDAGHGVVGDDNIEMILLQGFDGFFAAGHGDDGVIKELQDHLQRFTNAGFVVGDQNTEMFVVL